jgi:hypothetical protein
MRNVVRENGSSGSARTRQRLMWLALLFIALSACAIVVAPIWIIMPFKAQTARGLEISYLLRRWSPLLTFAALALSLVLTFRLWRGARAWWRRGLLVLTLLFVGANAWLARQNHFEWMFKPLPDGAYAKAGEAAFVDDRDMVLAVELNGEAAAYPIRQMAYHHLVQDRVGGMEIVATY